MTKRLFKKGYYRIIKGKRRLVKLYHALECNCYDCRAGLSLKAKD